MKKFEGMLFCTDVDGTLYNSDRVVSKQNLDAIEYFKSEGGLFTFITGRVPITAKEIADTINPNAPYGCLNGGGIYDAKKNQYLWNVCLPDDFIELVREVDQKLPDIGFQYNTEKNIIFTKDNIVMEYFRKITGVTGISAHYEDVNEPVLKVVFGHEKEERIQALSELLNNHRKANLFDFIRSEKMLYELLPKGVSKGALLCKMAQLLDIRIEKTVAVGDYNNDVSMLKAAGIGFAVENAAFEAKAAADYITVSNDEHAIFAIVDALDRGIYKV